MNHSNRCWREEDGYYALDALFYDDWTEVLRMCQDEDEPDEWYIVSEKLGIEYDSITCETIEEAKEECEDKVKEMTGVGTRCIPFAQAVLSDKCVCCGKPAKHLVYWAKAY